MRSFTGKVDGRMDTVRIIRVPTVLQVVRNIEPSNDETIDRYISGLAE